MKKTKELKDFIIRARIPTITKQFFFKRLEEQGITFSQWLRDSVNKYLKNSLDKRQ